MRAVAHGLAGTLGLLALLDALHLLRALTGNGPVLDRDLPLAFAGAVVVGVCLVGARVRAAWTWGAVGLALVGAAADLWLQHLDPDPAVTRVNFAFVAGRGGSAGLELAVLLLGLAVGGLLAHTGGAPGRAVRPAAGR